MRAVFATFALLCLATSGRAQTAADSAAVRGAALDYIEGWYAADAARMERAVHPDLAKRWVHADEQGRSVLADMSAVTLIQQTRRGGGSHTPAEARRKDVEILDLHEGMASVRVTSAEYVDYMHMARWNGEWRIVNVLWDFLAEQAEEANARPAASDGPAARRLLALIAAVKSGSSERIRAFLREAYAPEIWRRSNEDRVVQWYTTLHDRSRGFHIDSLHATPTEAVALTRTELTGSWQTFSVRVESEPPHRIVAEAASFTITPPEDRSRAESFSDAERARETRRVARRLAEADAFSGVVLLAKDDSVFYLGAFGDADKERGIPIGPDTRLEIGSITKTFTAVAIARLVEEGKLSWDDPLGKFFPGFPLVEAREKVRLKHLLAHTSGLQDYLRYCERNPCPPEHPRSVEDYVTHAELAQEESLLFAPGSRWAYTNVNFVLLGRIIELASGRDYHAYVSEHVFGPAGLEDTGFLAPGRVPDRLAIGYEKRYTDEGVVFLGEARRPEEAEYGSPEAGAYSTARDLFRFAAALRSGSLLRPETVALLLSPKPELGAPSWGYGFDVHEERGAVGHGGTGAGASASLDMFLASGHTAVILSNYSYARTPVRDAIWKVLP